MKFSALPEYCRMPCLVALLSLVFGTLLVWWSWTNLERAEAEETRARRQVQTARAGWQGLEAEMARRQQGARLFHQLSERGALGGGQIRDWGTRLEELRHRLGLSELRWGMETGKPLEEEPGVRSSAMDFRVSRVWLEARLLREDDLLNLVEALPGAVPALVRPLRCELSRLEAEAMRQGELAATGPLRARCEFDFLTMESRGSAGSMTGGKP